MDDIQMEDFCSDIISSTSTDLSYPRKSKRQVCLKHFSGLNGMLANHREHGKRWRWMEEKDIVLKYLEFSLGAGTKKHEITDKTWKQMIRQKKLRQLVRSLDQTPCLLLTAHFYTFYAFIHIRI